MGRGPAVVAVVLAASALAGCESTAEQSARLARSGAKLAKGATVRVTHASSQVVVVSATALTDANGTAAAVALRNPGTKPLYDLPISVTALDRTGRKVAANDAAGLDPSLTHVAVLAPGRVTWWVDDQLSGSAPAVRAKATVGAAGAAGPPSAPVFGLSDTNLVNDPTSGELATGTVRNATATAQPALTIEAVSLKGDRVVAAGRGVVTNLAAGASAPFRVFFIGDPAGGRLVLAVDPGRMG